MTTILNALATPVVVLALAGLIAQSVFSIVSSVQRLGANRTARAAAAVQYAAALLSLVDGLPFDPGERAALKLQIAKETLQKSLPVDLERKIRELTP